MFTTGVVFSVLALTQIVAVIIRPVALKVSRSLLNETDTPFLRHELAKSREELQERIKLVESFPTFITKLAALLFLAVAITCFYLQ